MRIVEHAPAKLDMPDEMQVMNANGAAMVVNPRKNLMEMVQGMTSQELEQLYADYRSRGRYRYGMCQYEISPKCVVFPRVHYGLVDGAENEYLNATRFSDPVITAIPEAMVRGWHLAKKLGRALDEA